MQPYVPGAAGMYACGWRVRPDPAGSLLLSSLHAAYRPTGILLHLYSGAVPMPLVIDARLAPGI